MVCQDLLGSEDDGAQYLLLFPDGITSFFPYNFKDGTTDAYWMDYKKNLKETNIIIMELRNTTFLILRPKLK